MKAGDSLGDRMKRYELPYSHHLTPRTPVIVRVDGRAFHTWTRGLEKPYDTGLINCMRDATAETAKEMQGCKLAYTQSDEASFLLTDYDELETQPWFGYDLAKVVSLTSSIFTARFNARHFVNTLDSILKIGRLDPKKPATFDARAFNIPESDVSNYFLWRAKDWHRNSIQMLAQVYFSPKELHGKKLDDCLGMLEAKGINWHCMGYAKYGGTYLVGRDRWLEMEPTFEAVDPIVTAAIKGD